MEKRLWFSLETQKWKKTNKKNRFLHMRWCKPNFVESAYFVNKTSDCAAKNLFKFPSRISEFKVKISRIKRSLKITMTTTGERWKCIFLFLFFLSSQCRASGLPCVSQPHPLEELSGSVSVFLSLIFFFLSLLEKYNSGVKSIIMFRTSPSEILQERELSWLEG